MIYRIIHATTYDYPQEVSISHNLAHLKARDTHAQTCLDFGFETSVPHSSLTSGFDFFGNPVTYFTVQVPHRVLKVQSSNLVDVRPPVAPDALASPAWEDVRETLRAAHDPTGLDAYQYCFDSPLVRDARWLAEYAGLSFQPRRPLLDATLDLTARIFRDFTYDPTATTNATPIADVFKMRRGVCQDFAHLQIACLRSLGLSARYVSGYLQTTPPPGRPRLIGADASHAWLATYCPIHGWVDFDPTNNQIPADKHITVAWGRDYDDVSPIKGVILGGGRTSLRVSVDVVPVEEIPATTA